MCINALYHSVTIHTLYRFTLRFRYCVVHGETGRIRHSCLYIPRSVAVVINIAHLGILCDHVPNFNIDFGFLIPYALFPKPCPSPTFITRRISQNCQLPTHKLTGLFGNYMGLACSLRLTHFSQSPLLIFEQF